MTQRSRVMATVISAMLLASHAFGQVLISEVHAGSPDFVEITNCGAMPVDLSGWSLLSHNGSVAQPTWTWSSGAVIQPGAFLVIEDLGVSGGSGSQPGFVTTGFNWSWTADSDIEVLLAGPAGEADYLYRDGTTVTVPGPYLPGTFSGLLAGAGAAIQRIVPCVDTDHAADWRIDPTTSQTPGSGPAAATLIHILSAVPSGNGCQISIGLANGTPGYGYLLVATVNVTAYPPPTGWFLGIDIHPIELGNQIAVGPPFFGTLDLSGGFLLSSNVNASCPLGLSLGVVAAEFTPSGAFARSSLASIVNL
jgi:hypothetical protein